MHATVNRREGLLFIISVTTIIGLRIPVVDKMTKKKFGSTGRLMGLHLAKCIFAQIPLNSLISKDLSKLLKRFRIILTAKLHIV